MKAELYIFLQKKLKQCLDIAINTRQRQSLHSDIVQQFQKIQLSQEDKVYESFSENQEHKCARLAQEFDTVCDLQRSERHYINYLVDHPNDGSKWAEYAQFCLRYGLQIKAEQCLLRQINCEGGDITTDMRICLASLLVQRQNYHGARAHLDVVLDADWTHLNANLLYGLIYKLTGWPEMSRKHFAIAKVKRLRDLGLLAPKSSIPKNFRTESIEFKVEIIDFKKVKTIDETIDAKNCDLLFFDFIDFLI